MKRNMLLIFAGCLLTQPASLPADDYVLTIIDCPTKMSVTISLPDKIGSDPTFSEVKTDTWVPATFRGINRQGQMFRCTYSALNSTGIYVYTAHREIIDCEPAGTGKLRCRVKP